jgi:transketolase
MPESLREAFGRILVKLAPLHDFYVVDCDVAQGTGTHHFREAYPQRFIQAGIAEQNATGLAAGLSTEKPVFLCLFSQFALRAYEIAMLSIAYANRNVKIILSHVGAEAGPDGASNQSINHYAVWRTVPNMVVIHPADEIELEKATRAILDYNGPVVMFTGRNPQGRAWNLSGVLYSPFEIGKCHKTSTSDNPDLTIIASGVMARRALDALKKMKSHDIYPAILNMSTIKPIDSDAILEQAAKTGAFVTCEDHSIVGGLGSAVAEVTSRYCPVPIEMVGIKDKFGQSGTPEELAKHYHLTSDDIVDAALEVIERKKGGQKTPAYDELCRRAYKNLERPIYVRK